MQIPSELCVQVSVSASFFSCGPFFVEQRWITGYVKMFPFFDVFLSNKVLELDRCVYWQAATNPYLLLTDIAVSRIFGKEPLSMCFYMMQVVLILEGITTITIFL